MSLREWGSGGGERAEDIKVRIRDTKVYSDFFILQTEVEIESSQNIDLCEFCVP